MSDVDFLLVNYRWGFAHFLLSLFNFLLFEERSEWRVRSDAKVDARSAVRIPAARPRSGVHRSNLTPKT